MVYACTDTVVKMCSVVHRVSCEHRSHDGLSVPTTIQRLETITAAVAYLSWTFLIPAHVDSSRKVQMCMRLNTCSYLHMSVCQV